MSVTQVFEVEYVTDAVLRADNTRCAYGLLPSGIYHLIFPIDVLVSFFPPRKNYYEQLHLKLFESDEKIIKENFRELAKVTHPDHNHAADANDKFAKLKEAYDTLLDTKRRARYNIGIDLSTSSGVFSPPVRCGLLFLTGEKRQSMFWVSEILYWKQVIHIINGVPRIKHTRKEGNKIVSEFS